MRILNFKTTSIKRLNFSLSAVLLLLICFSSYAQVGINTTNPMVTLDIRSSNQVTPANNDGILIPKIDNFPTTSPTVNQDGMMVFVTGISTPDKGFYYWDNSTVSWILITDTVYNTLDQAYDQGGLGLGKNINATDGTVRINGTDGFLVTGSFGNGSIIDNEVSGSGIRMFFNPKKAAFRSGKVFGTQWNNANIGDYSTAFGINTIASGNTSTALGNSTIASGVNSIAFGSSSEASGFFSTAFGTQSTASGDHSTAFGTNSLASGAGAFSFGYFTVASGNSAFAFGNVTIASGLHSTAFGRNTIASGVSSTAFGYNAEATEEKATAFGHYTEASGNTSTAFGYYTNATGIISTAFGNNTTASGERSTAFGFNTISSGDNSTAFGYNTDASGFYSTAFGTNTEASGYTATSFGQNTIASSHTSTALGRHTTASGVSSMAFGSQNIASGTSATAFGDHTNATGSYATAFGRYTNASALYSTAFGNQTYASNTLATAFGQGSSASGFASTSFGVGTISLSYSETAIGSFNTSYLPVGTTVFNSSDKLFIIGNGTSNSTRSNALTIYKSGLMNINDAYDMPLTDGTVNQVMVTNGTGVVSFQDANTLNGNTLDQAYDQGGFGAGRIINATNGPVEIHNSGGLIVESTNQTHMLFVDGTNDAIGIKTAVPTADLSVNGTANKLGGGTWAVFSDVRLKKNISNYNEGLELITNVRPVNFSYNAKMSALLGKNKSTNNCVYQGVIAQELQKIAPDMVREVRLNKVDSNSDGKSLKSAYFLEVDPNKFTYALINAVQEQQEMIKKQQNKIKNQNTKIVYLEKQFKKQQLEIEAIKTFLKKS